MFGALKKRQQAPGNNTGHPLFVYGTLLPGERNHDLIEHLCKIKHATPLHDNVTVANVGIVDIGGLPAAYMLSPTLRPDDSPIVTKGVLYRMTNTALDILDQFEGHPVFYKRTHVYVNYPNGDNVRPGVAHLYLGGRPGNAHANAAKPIGELMYSPDDEHIRWVSDYRLRDKPYTKHMEVVRDRTFIYDAVNERPNQQRGLAEALAEQLAEANAGDVEIVWEDEEEERPDE